MSKSVAKQQMVQAEVSRCVQLLSASERGRFVLGDLHRLLDGPISQADGLGWAAVFVLLHCYEDGYAGTVLEYLSPWKGGES